MNHLGLLAATAFASLADGGPTATQYVAAVDCSPNGGVVRVQMSGLWMNTCIPHSPQLTVSGNRLDFVVDGHEGGVCFDSLRQWCEYAESPPLPDGVYRVFTTILPNAAVEHPALVIDCETGRQCRAQSLPGTAAGLNGPVFATAIWDPDGPGPADELLVVGGNFTQAGGQPASCIAAWNGEEWHALGPGVVGLDPNPGVHAIAVYEGLLVAGGSFALDGGSEPVNVAVWDGQAWTSMSGISGTVRAIAVHEGLVAAGEFFGGVGHVWRWTGEWAPMGTGVELPIFALTKFRGELIAGGTFQLKRWDGSTWVSLTPEFPAFGVVSAFTEYRGDLLIGTVWCRYPSWCSPGGPYRWDGLHITQLNGWGESGVGFLGTSGGVLVAGTANPTGCPGNGLFRLDGTRWVRMAGSDGELRAVASWSGYLFVGGAVSRIGTTEVHGIAAWACRLCRADFNNDGAAGVQDILDYLSAYFAGEPPADENGVGGVTIQDLFDFLAAYFTGCG